VKEQRPDVFDAKTALSCGSALGPEWATKSELFRLVDPEILNTKGSLRIHFDQPYIDVHVSETPNPDDTETNNNSSDNNKRIWERLRLYRKDEEIRKEVGGTIDKEDSEEETEMRREMEEREMLNGEGYRVHLRLVDRTFIHCDSVICAIGVDPNVEFLGDGGDIDRSENGALAVGKMMETSAPNLWAAGDCCRVKEEEEKERGVLDHNWIQMQLWSQAKAQGTLAAQCMSSDSRESCDLFAGVLFDLFAHTTHFFGYKVVLLGRYNGQGLLKPGMETLVKELSVLEPQGGKDDKIGGGGGGDKNQTVVSTSTHCHSGSPGSSRRSIGESDPGRINKVNVEIWTRITPGVEYIKLIVHCGRIVGALLVGDTDLEEMLENLILNKLDVSRLGIDLLDPDVDIEDYFD